MDYTKGINSVVGGDVNNINEGNSFKMVLIITNSFKKMFVHTLKS